MKRTCFGFLLLTVFSMNASALAAGGCDKKLVNAAFQIYKNDCGGIGKKSSCEVHALNGSRAEVKCGFTGEPDYSDFLDVVFVTGENCEIQKTYVKSCYTD